MRVLLVMTIYLGARVLGVQLSAFECAVFFVVGIWNGAVDAMKANKARDQKATPGRIEG